MTRLKALVGLGVCMAAAVGCGGEELEGTARVSAPGPAERQAQLEANPYDLRCGDTRDKVQSARLTRIVQYALADDAKIRGLNRLQAAQSIFFAITELCKEQADSFEPARSAIAGVRRGDFRVDLNSP